jgi:three-Cys-motif partner protein
MDGGQMAQHEFGGDWTADKLERVRKYLVEYVKIFNANERARQYLVTNYVDAFAGTGYRTPSHRSQQTGQQLPELAEADNQNFLQGSARIALGVKPPFQRYLFIERDPDRAHELERLKLEFPGIAGRIRVEVAEANEFLMDWCAKTNWTTNRAVVFLDPYGMQVDWSLLKAIANTKAIDLWLLFPLGMAVNRLLTKNEPPPEEWSQALTRTFGTDKWRSEFYSQRKLLTLFGEEDVEIRQANFAQISQFFVARLKSIFTAVADNPLPLLNSKNVPLYLLCFASGNPQGAPTAIRIARHILRR